MKKKLSFSILILALALFLKFFNFGNIANQKIVLEFNLQNEFVDNSNTLQALKQVLLIAGVSELSISEETDGRLHISYYSKSSKDQIKQLILGSTVLDALSYSDLNENDESVPSKDRFNILEFNENSNPISDFDGVKIVQLNRKTDRSSQLKQFICSHTIQKNDYYSYINNNKSLFTNHLFSKEVKLQYPEVRAGPKV